MDVGAAVALIGDADPLSGTVGLWIELQPEGANDLQHGVETRATLAGKGRAKASPGEAGISGKVGHALGKGNVSERLGNEGSSTIGFVRAGFEIGGHSLWSSEMSCNIIISDGGLGHGDCSERLRARRNVALTSLACVYFSRPASRMTDSRPRCLKYIR